ncbi:hypothetical protein TNCV_540521 [Trichonephila clavipes]|nr:hypothetical protein TNCV_540521 [Trichonephila clavipes]
MGVALRSRPFEAIDRSTCVEPPVYRFFPCIPPESVTRLLSSGCLALLLTRRRTMRKPASRHPGYVRTEVKRENCVNRK